MIQYLRKRSRNGLTKWDAIKLNQANELNRTVKKTRENLQCLLAQYYVKNSKSGLEKDSLREAAKFLEALTVPLVVPFCLFIVTTSSSSAIC